MLSRNSKGQNQAIRPLDGLFGEQERAWVEVNLAALQHNVKNLRQLLTPETDLMAVVKADAYGHGAIKVAQTALSTGAGSLAVATIQEGIELRQAGIQAPILVLGATNHPEQVRAIAYWALEPAVCTPRQALIFSENLGSEQPLPVHLQVDTGMGRLGTPWEQAIEFVQFVRSLPNLTIASLYSHLATADESDQAILRQQQTRFEHVARAVRSLPGLTNLPLHLANSAATLLDSNLHYDRVRIGLSLYGLYPAPHLAQSADLQPVLQVKARITQIKTLQAGAGVSYGYRFMAPRDMQIAVVGVGYADGVFRRLSNQMQVLVQGKRVPQVGSVTMDQLMIDISTIPEVKPGDTVTLIGRDAGETITAEDWANQLGTISWEVLCGFKKRLPRVFV